jgi:hypothetical protein
MDVNVILQVATLAVVTVGGYLLRLGKTGLEEGVKASAKKGAEVAIENYNWPQKLSQELQKVRGAERQELRFKAYGLLWSKQRPLAIYDHSVLDGAAAKKLSAELSDWYFNEDGGLLLTRHVRDFYFALQDLLRSAGAQEWRAERSPEAPREMFTGLLAREGLLGAQDALEYLTGPDGAGVDPNEWPGPAASLAKRWRQDIARLATRWDRLQPAERFAVLQQVASTLRTSMVNDVESRLR